MALLLDEWGALCACRLPGVEAREAEMPPRDLKKARRNSAGHRSLINALMVAPGDKAGAWSRVVVGLP